MRTINPIACIPPILAIACWSSEWCYAHHPPNTKYPIYRFADDRLPEVDGYPRDWESVPQRCHIGTEALEDTVMGHGTNHDLGSLDVDVVVGWNDKTNRLYFLYRVDDDAHVFTEKWGDIFEIVVDADHSGGPYHSFADVDEKTEERLKSAQCQNYHIFTPPGKGRPWAWVWGSQQWLVKKPWARHAYRCDFQQGEPGRLWLEFYITPFDYASYRGAKYSAEHDLEPTQIIGLSWSVLDYDNSDTKYEGFWNLSHHTRMDRTADLLPNFRLMP
ncbi:MAG: hypothetical protein GW893_21710 [Armatimonadetes bacterium]|nr:hypothetical protein [Armatimonadota bacterium]PIU62455.1 MAG: hypothetical protein COS85_18485 [Armatimonadetes bacterium CG07_land_8_20_14_0_80_59_28]PIX44250.1 MAG: hypothetical protein COZ56_04985 [Armatimonadetes bacterium CG_4_8_14_3_um_filter_58_9]PIY42238.1 MAG: hypothetical protein COZ05_14255 [Armatimonadetes bacterium CG_4_10_14_3_um_filter_59_10]PJB76021.1 MAG: hypothetical protein CO095_03060 [Armatimonadetes bacterium CG_4_9_14_3_um_filter_58_7]